jgi:hypothetical protein
MDARRVLIRGFVVSWRRMAEAPTRREVPVPVGKLHGVIGDYLGTAVAAQLFCALLPKLSIATIDIMPDLQANDGVNLHYKTYGSNDAPPLILVSARNAPPPSATTSY